ncbi:OB-fold domain-containing protein [Azospirillum sp. HJ39]|uniref:Zn-ribbon domain-containing OB-fold protein n=1 Tax=Azospirillum sp. HJ39 TaxID=3159496 RepID=UPI00355731F1
MFDLFATPPEPTEASAPFWAGCDRQELLFPRCGSCGHLFYYPRRHCPRCSGSALGWQRLSGRGTVFSFTHVAVAFQGAEWEGQLPYTVVLVDLAEGPRMLSRLVGRSDSRTEGPAPVEVRSGDAVTVVFPQIVGRRFPFFEHAATG